MIKLDPLVSNWPRCRADQKKTAPGLAPGAAKSKMTVLLFYRLFFLSYLLLNRTQRAPQRRDIVGQYLPDKQKIDPLVIVYDPVAQPVHFCPRDLRMRLGEGVFELVAQFAHLTQVEHAGSTGLLSAANAS